MKQWWLRITAVMLGALVSLGIGEIALRSSGYVTVRSVRTVDEKDFPKIPGMFEPLQDLVETPHPALTYHVTINSLGFRGTEVSLPKPLGTTRILCMGDSFTYGSYVNDEDTFSALLQEEFNRRKQPVEVLNGGVGGSTIVDQIHFTTRALAAQPDLVILTFTENDISDLRRWEPMYVSLEKNRKLKSGVIVGAAYRLLRDSALFNLILLVKGKYWDQSHSIRSGPQDVSTQLAANDLSREWARYSEYLKELKQYLDTRKVRLVFAIFPSDYRFSLDGVRQPVEDGGMDRIEQLAKDLGILNVNYLSPLRETKRTSKELFLLPYDGHPRGMAYASAARAMYGFLAHNRTLNGMSTTGPFHESTEPSM